MARSQSGAAACEIPGAIHQASSTTQYAELARVFARMRPSRTTLPPAQNKVSLVLRLNEIKKLLQLREFLGVFVLIIHQQ